MLTVDDTPLNREILRDQLQSWGIAVTCTADPNDALPLLRAAAAEGQPFGLVMLDRQLPEVDGFKLAAEINRTPEFSGLPILMLTPLDSSLEPAEVRRAGIAGIVTKPIRQSHLLDSIMNAVGPHSLVVDAPEAEQQYALDSNSLEELTSTIRLLVAEDNEINRLVTGELLATQGYRYDMVCNGREAVNAVRREKYDIILMDCEMPEMDGWEATREIRRWEAEQNQSSQTRKHIPIIALTANAVRGDREKCLSVGMDEYITKPLDRTKFLATILAQAERLRTNSSTSSPAPDTAANTVDELIERIQPGPAPTPVPVPTPALTTAPVSKQAVSPLPESMSATGNSTVIDQESLLHRCSGDRRFAAKMLAKLQTRVPAEWVRLQEEIANGDAESIRKLAHALSGTSGNLSAVGVQLAARRLELAAREQRLGDVPQLAAELGQCIDELGGYLPQLMNQWTDSPSNALVPTGHELALSH